MHGSHALGGSQVCGVLVLFVARRLTATMSRLESETDPDVVALQHPRGASRGAGRHACVAGLLFLCWQGFLHSDEGRCRKVVTWLWSVHTPRCLAFLCSLGSFIILIATTVTLSLHFSSMRGVSGRIGPTSRHSFHGVEVEMYNRFNAHRHQPHARPARTSLWLKLSGPHPWVPRSSQKTSFKLGQFCQTRWTIAKMTNAVDPRPKDPAASAAQHGFKIIGDVFPERSGGRP